MSGDGRNGAMTSNPSPAVSASTRTDLRKRFFARGGHGLASGWLNVSSMENCFVARTACGRLGGR